MDGLRSTQASFICPLTPVLIHPLMPLRGKKEEQRDQKEQKERAKDPISNVTPPDFLDPLGAAAPTPASARTAPITPPPTTTIGQLHNTLQSQLDDDQLALAMDPQLLGFRPWRELRDEILLNYGTSDLLSLESSFLPPPTSTIDTNHSHKEMKRRELVGSDSPLETTVKFYDLSQEGYVAKMGDLRRILLYLWEKERRLDCIKLISEVARLLSTSSPCPQFYPAQFVHVSDLLDLFSQLVYSRLRKRASVERRQLGMADLPEHFSIDDVLEQTRITARNWFGKIGDIKELIPRLYVEAALLPCMRFMDPTALGVNVMRLCSLCRQVQHPLIAAYVRSFICRISMRINPTDRAPHWQCLNDWLQRQAQHHLPALLLRPALQYIIGCVAYGAISQEDLSPLWEYCRLEEKRPLVLEAMLNALPPIYLAEHAVEATKIVTGSDQVNSDELCALGRNLLRCGAIGVQARKLVLKAAWKCILRLQSLKAYLQCSEVWVEFVARHFSLNELSVVLENTLRRLHSNREGKRGDGAYSEELLSMLGKMVNNTPTPSHLLQMDAFPPFVDLFRDDVSRTESASIILAALGERHAPGELSDLGLSHLVVELCRRLNDSLSVSSPAEEVERVSGKIRRALDCFDFTHTDPEHALSFCVSCRAALLDNDTLQRYTIRRIQELTLFIIRHSRSSSRSSSRSTSRSNFLQACLANLFITIPSLASALHQLQLAIQSAELALASMAFLQLDAFIDLALELFKGRQNELQSMGAHFLSLLLTTPIEGAIGAYRRFFSTLKSIKWTGKDAALHSRVHLLFGCMQFLLSHLTGHQSTAGKGQWSLIDAEQSSVMAEELGAVMEELEPLLQTEAPVYSMELVELVSIYVGEGMQSEHLPDGLRNMARDAFKRCKREGAFNQRLKMIKGRSG